MEDSKSQKERLTVKSNGKGSPKTHWYSIPPPVRRVFERFPLVTYGEITLPQRAIQQRNQHTLYIFANPFDPDNTKLSCNPTCLKWQTYLKINDVDFSVIHSSNHASPSGLLPFLIPASSSADTQIAPLTGGKILRWTSQQTMQEEESLDTEQEVYMSLIDQNIRNAWLYHLYIDQSNFDSVARPLYISTSSSNRFVQMSIAYQLRLAARDELLKSMHIIDGQDIYSVVEKAFESLSTFLDKNEYFSKDDQPGLFDASIFAYTQLLLDENLLWSDRTLPEILQKYQRLVDHRNRILSMCLRN